MSVHDNSEWDELSALLEMAKKGDSEDDRIAQRIFEQLLGVNDVHGNKRQHNHPARRR